MQADALLIEPGGNQVRIAPRFRSSSGRSEKMSPALYDSAHPVRKMEITLSRKKWGDEHANGSDISRYRQCDASGGRNPIGVLTLGLNDIAKFFTFSGAAGACALASVLSLPPAAATAQTLGLQVSCGGGLPNDWKFAADALDGRFLHIIWTGPQGQTRVSVLSYYGTNADGDAVFNGTLQDAIEIILVDGSAGSPVTGTEVAIYSGEWGWFNGTCRQLGSETPEGLLSSDVIRQQLVGMRDAAATNWLRRNGLSLVRVVTLSGSNKTERWQQDATYPVHVVFAGGRVADVATVPE
jgi:hypothetical protein